MPVDLTSGLGSLNVDRLPFYTAGIEAIKEYRRGGKVKAKAPKIRLLVNPFILPFVPVEILSADIGGLIQDVSMVKSRSAAGGSFSVTLADDRERIRSGPVGFLLRGFGVDNGFELLDLFKPMSLAYLYLDGYLVMQGYVNSARRQVVPGQRTVTIDCLELGNLYSHNIIGQTQIKNLASAHLINDPQKLLASTAIATRGVPPFFALNNIVNAFKNSSLLLGPKGYGFTRGSDGFPLAFRLRCAPSPLGAVSIRTILTQLPVDTPIFELTEEGGSFWSMLQSFAPEPFMELFTETGGRTIVTSRIALDGAIPAGIDSSQITAVLGSSAAAAASGIGISALLPIFNHLVYRMVPYNSPFIGTFSPAYPQLHALTMGITDLLLGGDFVIITDADIQQKDLGVSQEGQYTTFFVDLAGSQTNKALWRPSIAGGPLIPWMPGGIRTYYVRSLHTALKSYSANFLALSGQVKDGFEKGYFSNQMSQLLNYWFRNAGKFREGTIVTRSIPYARPGMALVYLPPIDSTSVENVRDIGIYYIDNVLHSRTVGGQDTTTFSVIRGTPLPLSLGQAAQLFADWEIFPPGPNMFDGEFL